VFRNPLPATKRLGVRKLTYSSVRRPLALYWISLSNSISERIEPGQQIGIALPVVGELAALKPAGKGVPGVRDGPRGLGTKDKKHVIYEDGHAAFPRPAAIRETLDWLDKYLVELSTNSAAKMTPG
jgi:hypothetical protein